MKETKKINIRSCRRKVKRMKVRGKEKRKKERMNINKARGRRKIAKSWKKEDYYSNRGEEIVI